MRSYNSNFEVLPQLESGHAYFAEPRALSNGGRMLSAALVSLFVAVFTWLVFGRDMCMSH
jgi:hypothetical protein